jgi:hypothetical protein
MAIGTEIAPAHPAAIGTIRVGAEMVRGVDVATAPPRQDEARGWGGRDVWVGGAHLCTVGAMRLGGEPRQGFGCTLAREPWGRGLRCRWGQSAGAGPCPLEHEAQPHQGNQCQLVDALIGFQGRGM